MPLSVVYNGATYYYILSLQGDVVAILDSSGVSVVEYTYDAWGRLLTTTGSMAGSLGLHNPLRYRSYVYDREAGLTHPGIFNCEFACKTLLFYKFCGAIIAQALFQLLIRHRERFLHCIGVPLLGCIIHLFRLFIVTPI